MAGKPTIPEVMPLIQEFYRKPGNGNGGVLHIVLEDGNVEDGHVRFCLQQARNQGDTDGIQIAELLLRMSKTQRGKISGKLYGQYCSAKMPGE
jgi:hypothetical protein